MKPTALLLLAAVLFSGASASAQSGFAVNPPAPFTVEEIPSVAPYEKTFGVRTPEPTPTLSPGDVYICQVGFFTLPNNAGWSQQAINDNLIGAMHLTEARFAETFELKSFGTFRLGAVEGIESVGVPLREDLRGSLVMVSIMETPAGRVVVSCPGILAEIDTAPPVFRTIRDSISLP
jgi:hypothetical protein